MKDEVGWHGHRLVLTNLHLPEGPNSDCDQRSLVKLNLWGGDLVWPEGVSSNPDIIELFKSWQVSKWKLDARWTRDSNLTSKMADLQLEPTDLSRQAGKTKVMYSTGFQSKQTCSQNPSSDGSV